MNGKDLLKLGLAASLVTGCVPMVAQPGYEQDEQPVEPTSTLVNAESTLTPRPTVIPTGTVDPAWLNEIAPYRLTPIVATAQAYATEGPQALIERGVAPEALSSYRHLKVVFNLRFLAGGQGLQYDNQDVRGGATIITSDEPGLDQHIFITTTGHTFDADNIGENYIPLIGQQVGLFDIEFLGLDVQTIQIGDNLVLGRGDFGLTFIYDKATSTDRAFIAIPKANIRDQVVLDELIRDALPADKIDFEGVAPNDTVVGICEPIDSGYWPIPIEEGKYIEPEGNAIRVGPVLTGGGCSGAGAFKVDANGKTWLSGINIANFPFNPDLMMVAVVYPFSDMGRVFFWDNMKVAIADEMLR